MLHSILLNLDGSSRARGVIEAGLRLAEAHQARLRGVTLVDTRRIRQLTATCESAAHVLEEQNRMHQAGSHQGLARADLSQACLAAGLNFDVRFMTGDPLVAIPSEARFHGIFLATEKGCLQMLAWRSCFCMPQR